MNSPQPQSNKDVKSFTDLELAELNGQLYSDLMIVQANLQAVQGEIAVRKEERAKKEPVETPEVKPVEEVK